MQKHARSKCDFSEMQKHARSKCDFSEMPKHARSKCDFSEMPKHARSKCAFPPRCYHTLTPCVFLHFGFTPLLRAGFCNGRKSVKFSLMSLETDFIVIGSGVAGLRASIELAQSGAQVTVLTKDKASESNTEYAQGGVAVVLSDDDNAELHEEDTLIAGAGLCDEKAVETLVVEGTKYIQQLIEWGTEFDKEGGKLVFTQEAAHSRRRILHAHGDSTGKEIVRALIARARQEKTIQLMPFANTESLIVRDGRCVGVSYLDPILKSAARNLCKSRDHVHRRRGAALYAHDKSAGRDGRRHGDGVFCRCGNGGYGICAISSDGVESGKCAEIFAFGSDARRRRDFAKQIRRAIYGAL